MASSDRDSRGWATARSNPRCGRKSGADRAGAVLALAQASYAEAQARTQAQTEQCERQDQVAGGADRAARSAVARPAGPEPRLAGRRAADPGETPADVIRQRPDVYRAQRTVAAGEAAAPRARPAAAQSEPFGQLAAQPVQCYIGQHHLQHLVDRAAVAEPATHWPRCPQRQRRRRAKPVRSGRAGLRRHLAPGGGRGRTVAGDAVGPAPDRHRRGRGRVCAAFRATEARHRVGLANLNELEEARRLRLNAESSAIALQQERFNAWVALYLALGDSIPPNPNRHPESNDEHCHPFPISSLAAALAVALLGLGLSACQRGATPPAAQSPRRRLRPATPSRP
ncbi:MAG: hypothetical protein MZW92_33770 [Comamonadaceae bacterium]|nr:hypothetical protein [Comamonadaceae bacterium]